MVLRIHHIWMGQSDRVIWLCEELGIPYEVVKYNRPAPKELYEVHPMGWCPVIEDESLEQPIVESTAILCYLIDRAGPAGAHLAVSPDQPNYPRYLEWLFNGNSNLTTAIHCLILMKMAGVPDSNHGAGIAHMTLRKNLEFLDGRLSKSKYLAGEEFTAADMMHVYQLTKLRTVFGYSLKPYPHILEWLQERIITRPAYIRAMEKAETWHPVTTNAEAPESAVTYLTSGGWIGTALLPLRTFVWIMGLVLRSE